VRGGYVKLARRLAEHRIWLREPFTMGQFWVHLLMLANYKPSRVLRGRKWIEIRRGQLFTSLAHLSSSVSRDRKTLRAWLLAFAQDGMLDIATAHGADGGYTLITIRNYEKYQGSTSQGLDNGLPNALPNERDNALPFAGDNAGDNGGDTSEEVLRRTAKEQGEEHAPRAPSPLKPSAGSSSRNGRKPGRNDVDADWGRISRRAR
jgi:hypothetical protein